MPRDNESMSDKLCIIAAVLLDILLLSFKNTIAIIDALYRLFVPPPEKSVASEVVLVTGAGHGIGRELSVQYAELGAIVVCVDVNEKSNEETVKLIKGKGSTQVFGFRCDITKRDEVLATVANIKKELGRDITVLVNNAGIMPAHSFLDHTHEEITKIFEVNVFAHFWLLQAILPDMIKNNHGHVVALSSMAGLIGLRNLVPYCATKFAVRGLMEALVEELREEGIASGVRFTCILPYMVNTGLCKKPVIKFESALKLVSPSEAATAIITAMRRNELMVTIPSYFMTMNNVIRCLPFKVGQNVKDFFGAGVEAE